MNSTFADLGEDGVLSRITRRLTARGSVRLGPGDDAAVLNFDGDSAVTTDMLVEGEDFRTDWSTARDVGAKAAAQNLADIAAMGAIPRGLVVALGAPDDTPARWADGLADGLDDECARVGVGVIGGDLSRSERLIVSVTAVGELSGRAPVLRSGAAAGDVVAIAGTLGRAAAGLDLLAAGQSSDGTDGIGDLISYQRPPGPPYSSGPAAADAGATAMLDVSDGLVRDASRIATASRVGIDLDGPFDTDVDAVRAAADRMDVVAGPDANGPGGLSRALGWVLGGGEDHGMLATFPPETTLPESFRVIGRVTDAAGVAVFGAAFPADADAGWDHFGTTGNRG